ncbi:hypothetical protein GDO81_022534 [Engystomops pustulosus]|uniref:Fructose-bisphosphate aldolase n=1 Tax=Engystomops pustulosus TaxID=76066 RepID=A0AAV6YXL9_ENGPU|nr:hypothetical protein GDO81_022534 [Engystomops pustulosus]
MWPKEAAARQVLYDKELENHNTTIFGHKYLEHLQQLLPVVDSSHLTGSARGKVKTMKMRVNHSMMAGAQGVILHSKMLPWQ